MADSSSMTKMRDLGMRSDLIQPMRGEVLGPEFLVPGPLLVRSPWSVPGPRPWSTHEEPRTLDGLSTEDAPGTKNEGSRTLAALDPDRFQLTLVEIRGVEEEREDVAGAHGAGDAAVLGHGFDALTVDLDEHRAALDASVERRAHGLDAGDQDALDAPRHIEAFGGL